MKNINCADCGKELLNVHHKRLRCAECALKYNREKMRGYMKNKRQQPKEPTVVETSVVLPVEASPVVV